MVYTLNYQKVQVGFIPVVEVGNPAEAGIAHTLPTSEITQYWMNAPSCLVTVKGWLGPVITKAMIRS